MKEEILEEVKKTVLSIDSNAEVVLFGSHARGDAHKHSDWDFLILTELEEGYQTEKRFWDALYEIELKKNVIISAIIHSKKNKYLRDASPLYQNIQKEGITI